MCAKTVDEGRETRVAVSGALGRMGRVTCRAIAADDELALVARVDPAFDTAGSEQVGTTEDGVAAKGYKTLEEALAAGSVDVVVDFSVPGAVKKNVLLCIEWQVPVVVGTSGLGAQDLAEIDAKASGERVPVLVAPNFAWGAVLMMRFAEEAARRFEACEIVELHHADKVDAPSGTARLSRQRIEEVWRRSGTDRQVPVHSVRLPGLVAHQEVIFGGPQETLTIRHDSLSRESFMPGVLHAVKRVRTLQGLVVGLENIL